MPGVLQVSRSSVISHLDLCGGEKETIDYPFARFSVKSEEDNEVDICYLQSSLNTAEYSEENLLLLIHSPK